VNAARLAGRNANFPLSVGELPHMERRRLLMRIAYALAFIGTCPLSATQHFSGRNNWRVRFTVVFHIGPEKELRPASGRLRRVICNSLLQGVRIAAKAAHNDGVAYFGGPAMGYFNGSHTEITMLHIGCGGEIGRGAGPDHAAALDNNVPVGNAGERGDVLVDDQNGLAGGAQRL
jgi:hypothetical protein